MKKELEILDKIETIRRKAKKDPEVFSTDFTIRVIETIISEAAGYKNRVEWTNELKNCDSEYKKWIDNFQNMYE